MNAFDYRKLRGRIREKTGTQEALACRMNVSAVSLNKKLNNKCDFTQNEIFEIMNILKISSEEISSYFFSFDS